MWWIVFALIVIFAVAPILPILILSLLGMADGLNEGNSTLATLPWMLMFTLPIGAGAMLLWIGVGIVRLLSGIDHGEN